MIKDLALVDFDVEMATTRRFLERVPESQLGWQPHDKSMKLGRLSMHLAEIPGATRWIFDGDEFSYGAPGTPPPKGREASSTAELLETFDKSVGLARAVLDKADDATFAKPWTFKAFGQTIYTKPKIVAFRLRVLSHSIHHRAQLGVYLRLLGVSNPPTPYGPSADERP
ncbi:MAG TPA: DinB family protein [Gemmatimonadaceae bacterium]|nr:DinB family protein [Gemmatimonadaceae bacterium]